MNRTRTLIILGIFMLCLAVLAALELRTDDSVLSEGQMVTGSVSKEVTTPENPTGTNGGIPPSGSLSALPGAQTIPSNGGVLVPLDNGTLRGSGASPFDTPNATSPDELARKTESSALNAIRNDPDGENINPRSAASSQFDDDTPPKAPQLSPAEKPAETPKKIDTPQLPEPIKKAEAPQKSPEEPRKSAESPRTSSAQSEKNTPSSRQADTPEKKGTQPQQTEKAQKTQKAEKASPSKPKAPAPLVLTADAPDKLVGGQKAITRTRLELGKEIAFRITGAAPLKVKTLLLAEPDRYVVDLQGEWGIEIPRVPKNLILKEIRVGKREGATRLVFELNRKPASAQVNKINSKTFEVQIK